MFYALALMMLSSSASATQPPTALALATPRQGLKVQTHVLPACGGCDEWLDIMSDVTPDFPNIQFETVHVDYAALTTTTSFPYTTVILDDPYETTLRYTYKKIAAFFRRWLLDLSHGRYSLVSNVTAMEEWFTGFSSWMHVLSPEYPVELNRLSKTFLSTGFAWTQTNRTSYTNTVLLQPLQGNLRMQFNVASLRKELRSVMPPIIPYDLALNHSDYVYVLFDQEVHVYTNKTLEPHWWDFKKDYPGVAVIQMVSEDEDAVWTRRRSVQFKYNGLDAGVREWYAGISKGLTPVEYRPSVGDGHVLEDGTYELSGDSLWSFVLGHRQALVYEYDETTVETCESEVVTEIPLGRLDVRTNDHETLPEASSPGWVHYYLSGRIRKSFKCSGAREYLAVLDRPSRDEL